MKKVLNSISLLALSALLLAGCGKDMLGLTGLDGDVQQVTFTASILQEMTKAAADGDGAGASVNRCIMEIYYGGELFERKYSAVSSKSATFTTQLVSSRTYTVAFWADCVTATTSTPTAEELATDLYYTTNAAQPDGGLQAIALNGDYSGNNDARDAFFAVKTDCNVVQGGSSFDIALTRPFAQINVITTDWESSTSAPDKVDVTIQSPLTMFNAVTGVASADASVTSLNYNTALYKTPTSGTDATLSMDYLFAPDDEASITISWEAQKSGSSCASHTFSNVPYQRNHRTNIKGALLTTTDPTPSCLLAGTRITMADGSFKKVEDIVEGDMVRTFDHEAGVISSAKVCLATQEEGQRLPLSLHFASGNTLTIAGQHGLLEKVTRKYTLIHQSNVQSYVGKSFFNAQSGSWDKLLSYEIGNAPVDRYAIYSAKHLNVIAGGMLTVEDDVNHILNIYELDENLKADTDQLAADIAKYGLLDVERDYPECIKHKQILDDLGTQYIYIAVGKGLISQSVVDEQIAYWRGL